MKTENIKNTIIHILYIFTSVLPISLSAMLFMGLNYYHSIAIASFSALLSAASKTNKIMPAYTAFLIMSFLTHSFGFSTASLAAFICGLISAVFYFLPKQFKIRNNPVVSGIMLATALTVTVLLTTHYFGIGANGNNVREMIASYLSLGFHPNWRGVLYGTIVMVIMITFPRKFKKLCQFIKAPFIAIIVTLILNLFLNPSDFNTAINEIGNTYSVFPYSGTEVFAFIGKNDFNIIPAVLSGIALFFVCNYALTENEADINACRFGAFSNIWLGTFCGFIMPYGTKSKKMIASGVGACLLCIAVLVWAGNLFNRIPVHSLAVVMIVGAWESVKWSEIKNAFSSPISIICFILSVVSCLVLNIVYGIIISAVICIIFSLINKSKVPEISQ